MTDQNNNISYDLNDIDPDNVEVKLEKLKLIGNDYESDDDDRDKVRLSGGIDIHALKAGNDVEFELDSNNENYNWYDENDKIDYVKLFRYRNLDMIAGDSNDNGEENSASTKTPFEALRLKMFDITPNNDRGVLKRVIQAGNGKIPDGARVRIHYNAYFELNDEPFDSTHLRGKTFEFKLGANQVVLGLDIAVSTMKKYEISQFIFEPEYYCGKFGCEPRVPRNTPVMFEVEIVNVIEANAFDQYEDQCDEQRKKLTFEQMLQICNCLRELGNDNYKRQNYREASKKYRKAIYLLDNTSVSNEEQEKKWKGIMLKLYLNMSQISLKQAKPKKTIYYCKLALDYESNNVKALFRYGQSLRMLQDFERSRFYLNNAYKLHPTNEDIKAEIMKLNQDLEKYKILEKDLYQKMFKTNEKPTKDTKNQTLELNLDEKIEYTKFQDSIIKYLNEYNQNQKIRVLNVQHRLLQPELKEFLIKQAKLMNFEIRNIQGETLGTNVIQILKK